MPRKQEQIKPPSREVEEKQDPEYTKADFADALERATRRRDASDRSGRERPKK